MKSSEVRKKMVLYIRDISFLSVDGIIKKNEDKIKDLSKTLSSKLDSIDEVDEYLDYIIDYIDNTNKYFKKEGKGRIPYSLLFTFASYEDKLSEFIFDRNVGRKKREDPGLAGITSSDESNNLKDFSISFKDNDYDFIHTEGGEFFFFSNMTRKVVVQLSTGKVVFFSKFKKMDKKKRIPQVRLAAIYNKVKKVDDKNDAMISFMIYFKQMRMKIVRRKNKKRTSSR